MEVTDRWGPKCQKTTTFSFRWRDRKVIDQYLGLGTSCTRIVL